ncbi:MAG: capsule biosynthesis protein [Roseovarius sp. BRH_c41]|jgi:capsular polysaccharide transport system permease protein|uniref:capsule biosynthesis protein n=1 Tax=Roseovarius sp. BRH_c41 TaxID=1629709 RepID=UPI0005F18B07|nr:capsule biosynthesis protein [Roseovarius sp. BRH_c41]KJS42567.1 MAG: capsule biosynthesis protein [Roseovarius sp. BRH_c41]
MITKPKARKFRIRRSPVPLSPRVATSSDAPSAYAAPHAVSAATAEPLPLQAGQVASARETSTSQNIDDIRREGLTGRELRMARRLAQKYGLAPTSDFDAVRLLRARGIDPFQRANILELVANDGGSPPPPNAPGATPASPSDGRVQLPQTVPAGRQTLPSTDVNPADRRAQEIMAIQRDIGRRRRRKLILLFSRLAAFVLLPTILVSYYFYAIATPMYATKSAFLILSADGGGASGGGLGGLIPSQFATGQDAIATQEYLESKDAMLRLDEELGFLAHFSQPWIDPLQRLDPDASHEVAYKLYRKYVKLGYDPTEGVIRMEVSTADPAVSAKFSERLIKYAEERVDDLSREKRQDAVSTAADSLDQAKIERRAAQQMLVTLQEDSILDPEGEIASIRNLIGTVELQLQEKELALNIQMNNARPNGARVEALQSEIMILSAELDKQKRRLTDATAGESSLASKTAAIQMAQADLATADLVLQSALEAKRQSEIEANKQVRYLTVSVRPLASQDSSYPRAFENTILAFLIFSGIYLLISLTASILREQVSS